MNIQTFDIAGPLLLLPKKHNDARGFFVETFRKDALAQAIGNIDFVQDNQSYSAKAGTVRALHFQVPPAAQAKLVRVIRGSVMDVAVDIRRASPTYGRHVSATLSADNLAQLYVPVGFAHGFCTLEPDTEVVYKVSAYYDPGREQGLAWDDPALNIAWPAVSREAVIADRDRTHPRLKDLAAFF